MPILETYAQALMQAADENNQLDAVFHEAEQLRMVIAQKHEILHFMERPAIEKDEKKALLRRILEGRISPIMLYLPLILIDNNRGGLWDAILEMFITEVDRRNGILPARIVTARPLAEDEKKSLRDSLEKRIGKHLHIDFREQPCVTGGVLFRCEDLMIDSTISRALEKLGDRLHAIKVA